jgi:hypothetical protein
MGNQESGGECGRDPESVSEKVAYECHWDLVIMTWTILELNQVLESRGL